MYRLLAADDEKIALDAIEFIISKNFSKCIILETARSGREAIEKADDIKPDIIIMDIRMPGINGIDAIREIKERLPNVTIIIISAYEQFEYAKEAVKLGVIEYILKPLNKKKIISVIEKAVQLVEKDRLKRKMELESKEKFQNILPMLEQSFIYSIILKKDFYKDFNKYKEILNFIGEGGYLIIFQFNEKRDLGKERFRYTNKEFYTYFRNTLKYKCRCLVGPLLINRIIVYVSEEEKKPNSHRIESIDIAKYLLKKIAQKYNNEFDISIGIGTYKNIEKLSISYDEGLKALHCNNSIEITHFYDIENSKKLSREYPKNSEKKLLEKTLLGETEDAFKIFEDIYEWILENYENSFENGRNKLIELMVYLHRSIIEVDVNIDEHNKYKNYIGEIYEKVDYTQLEQWSRKRIINLCNTLKNTNKNNVNKIIIKAKDYIDKEFKNEITLEDVAKEVCVSSNYFSRLFKEQTSENFIEYLTKVRIDKAVELMRKTDLNVKEICFSIGYADPNYFSRLFKKVMNITPTEYMKSFKNH